MGKISPGTSPQQDGILLRLCKTIKRNFRKVLLSACLSVFITIFWAKVEHGMIVLVILASIGLVVWAMTSQLVSQAANKVFKNEKRTLVVLTVVLGVVVMWLEGFQFREDIVSFIPSSHSTTVVYQELRSAIDQTNDPDYKRGERTYQYALLIEFSSKNALVDIVLYTDNEYLLYDTSIGRPGQKTIKPTYETAIHQRQGSLVIGPSDVNVAQKPKSLAYSSSNALITTTASFYVYLESDKPLKVVSANFDGQTFELVGNKLIPKE